MNQPTDQAIGHAPLPARRCETCACYCRVPQRPGGPPAVCLLNPPQVREALIEPPPGLDIAGQLVGREPIKAQQVFRAPTRAGEVCWQWRSTRCLPGENEAGAGLREVAELVATMDLTQLDQATLYKRILMTLIEGARTPPEAAPDGATKN